MRQKRLYSLFQMIDGHWVRQSELALHKDEAVRFFQNRLLSGSLGGQRVSLRVVDK